MQLHQGRRHFHLTGLGPGQDFQVLAARHLHTLRPVGPVHVDKAAQPVLLLQTHLEEAVARGRGQAFVELGVEVELLIFP